MPRLVRAAFTQPPPAAWAGRVREVENPLPSLAHNVVQTPRSAGHQPPGATRRLFLFDLGSVSYEQDAADFP